MNVLTQETGSKSEVALGPLLCRGKARAREDAGWEGSITTLCCLPGPRVKFQILPLKFPINSSLDPFAEQESRQQPWWALSGELPRSEAGPDLRLGLSALELHFPKL